MKEIYVTFIDKKTEEQFESLAHSSEQQLYEAIQKAIITLKEDPTTGTKISKKLWPKTYKKYEITNLWKYDLPQGWRLIYTIQADDVRILNIILEWFNHKEYERRFKY